jgi:hypothetical protein
MDVAPFPRFIDFIEDGVDRFTMLRSILEERGLSPSVAELAGSRHLIVAPGGGASRRGKGPTVLVAHYDRSEKSPGANDNSAAVFQLIETIAALRAEGCEGWLAVFTDREENAETAGARGQGSFALAEGFKSIGLSQAKFFIFDACGRGDTIVISTAVDLFLKDSEGLGSDRTRTAVSALRRRALEAARERSISRIMLAPTPFSDDAGFLAAGLAAQTVTVLPAAEAATLAAALRQRPRLAAALLSREARASRAGTAAREAIPETWKLLHGPLDSTASLTAGAFPLVVGFASALCRV